MIKEYTIKNGDNLTRIAKRNGTTVNELARLNGIDDPDKIFVGDNLKVPDVQAMQQAAAVKQLLQQMQPPQGQTGMPAGLPAPNGQGAQPNQRGPMPGMFNPQQDAIESVAPEAMMMGAPGMIRGVGTTAMGGLGAMARGMPPAMAKAGRIQPPHGYSNIVPMGNSGAFNSSMAQGILNSKGGGLPQGAVDMQTLLKMLRSRGNQ